MAPLWKRALWHTLELGLGIVFWLGMITVLVLALMR